MGLYPLHVQCDQLILDQFLAIAYYVRIAVTISVSLCRVHGGLYVVLRVETCMLLHPMFTPALLPIAECAMIRLLA